MELRQVRTLARELMETHGVDNLTFDFDGGLSRIGSCRFRRSVAHKITLSKHWATRLPEDEIRDVILHEIAHALAGHEAGHGSKWKAIARRVGAKPVRCKTGHLDTTMELAKYHAICDCPIHKGKVLAGFHRLGKSWQRGKRCAASNYPIRVVEVR